MDDLECADTCYHCENNNTNYVVASCSNKRINLYDKSTVEDGEFDFKNIKRFLSPLPPDNKTLESLYNFGKNALTLIKKKMSDFGIIAFLITCFAGLGIFLIRLKK